MLDFSQAEIADLNIHYAGNKLKEEGFKLTDKNVLDDIADEDEVTLKKFFLRPFTTAAEFYAFYHAYDIKQNEVFSLAGKIFANPGTFKEHSKDLCRHLYECSVHPKVKGSEVYVVLFKGGIIYGQTVDVLGIFKCENKDKFINVEFNKTGFSKMNILEGTYAKGMDKGCLVFNISGEDGYAVTMVDAGNKGNEAQFWKDDFLGIIPRQDNYFNTANYLKMCKEFVVNELPKQHPVDKTHQIDILNRSVDFFKNHGTFDNASFTEEIFEQPEIINSFKQYKQEYERDNNFEMGESFEISTQAVKKQSKIFKSVLKLDKNFHVYIHGDRNLIERGFDEDTGKKFYKIYFDEEN